MNKLLGGQKTQLGVTMGNRGTLNQRQLTFETKVKIYITPVREVMMYGRETGR
jgi:hypothetical protein